MIGKPCIRCGSTERAKDRRCAPCRRESYRKWHEAHKERKAEYNRAWQKANKDLVAVYSRRYRGKVANLAAMNASERCLPSGSV